MLKNLSRPVALVDKIRCRENIERMSRKAKNIGLQFRPHFKTHQSIEIGNWFKDHAVDGITVSTPGMAGYFANGGWNDITIAFPFFPGQINAVNKLLKTCNLRLFVNRPEIVSFLNQNLQNPVQIYIEIDAGYGRTGVPVNEKDTFKNIIQLIKKSSKCTFHGFYIHDGRTYTARGAEEIKSAIQPALDTAKMIKEIYPASSFSLGDTPSCSVLEELEDIDEITPGNFVFYDLMQTHIGSCNKDNVAYFVACPVTEVNKANRKMIIHGGAVHLSKDYILAEGIPSYGQVTGNSNFMEITWDDKIHVRNLSQEHGTIEFPGSFNTNRMSGTDKPVLICPVHSCLSANLFSSYRTIEGQTIEKRIYS